MRMQITEVGMLKDERPGNLMERKERELQPAVAGARDTVTPGGHSWRGQRIQTLGNGPPQARIGTHGNGANHFIGTRGSRAMHAFVWNSRWWGELTVVGRISFPAHTGADGNNCCLGGKNCLWKQASR